MNSDNKSTKNPKFEMLTQGTFGCVFSPGPKCNNSIINPDSTYITKIQKTNKTSTNEFNIGQKIQTIANYQTYFAPILEKCDINLSTITTDNDFDKCNIIDTKSKKPLIYESNIIEFVGKHTLYEYFDKYKSKNHKSALKQIKRILRCNVHILKGINKLNDINVVHYDLKENNIMCTKIGTPIIIDFGISIDLDDKNTLKQKFYAYGPEYEPWCIESVVISKIVHEDDWEKLDITIEFIEEIINKFFKKNATMATLIHSTKQTYIDYFTGIINGWSISNKTSISFIESIMINSKSWDNYAIAILIYNYLQYGILQYDIFKKMPEIESYVNLLKEIIIASPDKRPIASDTITNILDTLKNIKVDNLKVELSQP